MIDYYAVLGLNRCATADEIKRAYKKLALKHHPDKNNGDGDSDFKIISEAYQILSDPIRRKTYDLSHNENINFDVLNEFASVLISVIHEKLKQNLAPKTSTQQSEVPKDIVIDMNIDIEDLYNHRIKKLVVRTARKLDSDRMHIVKTPIYVALMNYKDTYVFNALGDESKCDVKGNIVVKLKINSVVLPEVTVDNLFCKYDLHMSQTMTLYEFLYGIKDRQIQFYNDEVITVNQTTPSVQVKDVSCDIVVEVPEKGLPYIDDNGDIQRGILFIHFKLCIPSICSTILHEHENFFRQYFNETFKKQSNQTT